MQALPLVLCAFVFAGQAGAPALQPDWLTDLQGLQREAADAPLGSLDAKAEKAWAAALADPKWPELQTAAQWVSAFYDSQGYELKAEQVLRQALAAVPRERAEMRLGLTWALASHFEDRQQLVKAASLWEELPKAPDARGGARVALARVYERMGELEKAEAQWKQMAEESVSKPAGQGGLGTMGIISVPTDPEMLARSQVAAFYARHGRAADAEQVYKAMLADAAERGLPAWITATEAYIGFLVEQRRSDEALSLQWALVAKLEKSPDAEAPRTVLHARERLAGLLAQTGHADEAMTIRRRIPEQAREPSDQAQSLATLAQTLMDAKRLDEAEAVIEKLRVLGRSDPHGPRFHELMSAQMLARIREMQNKPDEARRLRESVGVPDVTNPKSGSALIDLAGPAQHKALRGDLDGAVADGMRALAAARDRVRTDPHELAVMIPLTQALMEKRRADAQRIAVEALRLLDGAPDHPRVADALGSLIAPLCELGLTGEAAHALERQERILTAAKGPDSSAMNAVGHSRIALLQRDSNWAGVVDERRRMLARVEKASGARSLESLYALREVAWAYSYWPGDNWSEEREILEKLLERTARLMPGQTDLANLYEHMVNRATEHGQYPIALEWAERGIEAARSVRGGDVYVRNMIQTRDRIRSLMRP